MKTRFEDLKRCQTGPKWFLNMDPKEMLCIQFCKYGTSMADKYNCMQNNVVTFQMNIGETNREDVEWTELAR
jgi:hypothetical protein